MLALQKHRGKDGMDPGPGCTVIIMQPPSRFIDPRSESLCLRALACQLLWDCDARPWGDGLAALPDFPCLFGT